MAKIWLTKMRRENYGLISFLKSYNQHHHFNFFGIKMRPAQTTKSFAGCFLTSNFPFSPRLEYFFSDAGRVGPGAGKRLLAPSDWPADNPSPPGVGRGPPEEEPPQSSQRDSLFTYWGGVEVEVAEDKPQADSELLRPPPRRGGWPMACKKSCWRKTQKR